MSDKLISTTSKLIETASSVTQNLNERANQVASWWKDYRAKNPTTDVAITRIGSTLDDIKLRLDILSQNITGEAALTEANALADKQRRYNDVLATRLAEALDRIELLEKRVAQMESKK